MGFLAGLIAQVIRLLAPALYQWIKGEIERGMAEERAKDEALAKAKATAESTKSAETEEERNAAAERARG